MNGFFDEPKIIGGAGMKGRRHRIQSGTNSSFRAASITVVYSDEWYTPPDLVFALGEFDLDPCAGPMSHAIENWRWPEKDGLSAPWHGRVWCNPPYSLNERFLGKLIAHGEGVALVNARTDTHWFQDALSRAHAALWLRGRVPFRRRPSDPEMRGGIGSSVLIAYGERSAELLSMSALSGVLTEITKRS